MTKLDEVNKNSNIFWSRTLVVIFLIGIIGITHFPSASWITNLTKNYLPVHVVLEFIGILISFAIFTVGWATYQNARSTDILVLSVISFMVGCFDLGHTLSFTGMPDFVTPSGPNKAIYFWLLSRFVGSVGFLFVSLSRPRQFEFKRLRFLLMLVAVLFVSTWFYLILYHASQLPEMFIPGKGLTKLKVILEWSTIVISLITGILFFRQGRKRNTFSLHWIGSASILFAMGGFFFTLYRDFDDLYNFAGHVYKAIAFVLVYRAVFIECISRPYEEARKSAKQALEANVSKSRFLANVSHEFRTPLGVISGFSDMLLESKSLVPENRRWAETISRNSKQLRVLIDDLLDLAKAENEKISVEWSTFSPTDSIEDVVSSLRLQSEKKGIGLVFTTEISRSHTIVSDPFRFSQILINLVGNAIKFTNKGDVHIFLKTNIKKDQIEVSIQDSGIGIDAREVPRLFKPFAQAEDPMNRRFGGTGLGLALSKKLANLLGGELWLHSSEMGKGSLFIFTVADQRDQSVVSVEEQSIQLASATPISLAGLKILAAEDSLDNQSLLSIYLEPTGVEVVFANNGKEAVRLATESTYDLILMDIQMPEMDGFEAVNQLRALGWTKPILALSAHAHLPERERALQNGFDDYLVKPISKAELSKAIANHTIKKLK